LSSKLIFLEQYFNIQYGGFVANISGGLDTIYWLVFTFIIILLCKNSIELTSKFKTNTIHLFAYLLLLFYALGEMNSISEFLYFNF